ncbi:hypothetical protein GQ457_03G000910 [Hibiscus cannabinus]
MDPCPFVRILVGNLALKFPPSTSTSLSRIHPSTSPYFCIIKLNNFPHQIDRIVKGSSCKVSVKVYSGPNGSTCGLDCKKLLGKVTVPLDLLGAESRPCVFGGEPECSPQVFQFKEVLNRRSSLATSVLETPATETWDQG